LFAFLSTPFCGIEGQKRKQFMMIIKDFEVKLQKEVSPKINFRQHPVNKDIVGIYYDDIYTETAIPANTINEERDDNYCDNFGYPHRGSIEAEARIKGFVDKFENDKEWREDFLAEI
jgi:hypothetical protein